MVLANVIKVTDTLGNSCKVEIGKEQTLQLNASNESDRSH